MNWFIDLLAKITKPERPGENTTSKEISDQVVKLYELAEEQTNLEEKARYYEQALNLLANENSKDAMSRKQLLASKLISVFEKTGELERIQQYIDILPAAGDRIQKQTFNQNERDELRRKEGSPLKLPKPGRHEFDFKGRKKLEELPGELTTATIDASLCKNLRTIGSGLTVRRFLLDDCLRLERLPDRLKCHELSARNCQFTSLPADLMVRSRLDLSNCTNLQELPSGLKVGALNLSGCDSLKALPEGIELNFLNISQCSSLEHWPESGSIKNGNLIARNCVSLDCLPDWLGPLTNLDLRGCVGIDALPDGLRVHGWIDIQGTGITSLPDSLKSVQIYWRGIPVDHRIAFNPESITAHEVLAERNVERRRALLDRMGNERFFQEANPDILDKDRDKGGERQLYRITMENDEDLVCVSFFCPSTGRRYLTRVPPTTRTCKQAVAWIAGFDKPSDYVLVDET